MKGKTSIDGNDNAGTITSRTTYTMSLAGQWAIFSSPPEIFRSRKTERFLHPRRQLQAEEQQKDEDEGERPKSKKLHSDEDDGT